MIINIKLKTLTKQNSIAKGSFREINSAYNVQMEYLALSIILIIVAGFYIARANSIRRKLSRWAVELGFTYVLERDIEGLGALRNYTVFPLPALLTGYIYKKGKDYSVYCYLESKRYNNLNIILLCQNPKSWRFEFREKHFMDKSQFSFNVKESRKQYILHGPDAIMLEQKLKDYPQLLNIFIKDERHQKQTTRSICAYEKWLIYSCSYTSLRLKNPSKNIAKFELEFREIILKMLLS